jgi:hypothetical protein
MIIAYFVRAGYIMLEFGPRAFKTIKRVMSCGLGCVVLCRFGMDQGYESLSWDAKSCGTYCMIFFLVMKLVFKVLTLLNLFKTRKKLRIIKLLKLTKCVASSFELHPDFPEFNSIFLMLPLLTEARAGL